MQHLSFCAQRTFLLLCALALACPARAQEVKIQPEALQSISSDAEWLRILYYVPRWSGSRSGLIDTPGFYLADDGASDALTELRATIHAMQLPPSERPDEHAICRFPRRVAYIIRKLKIDPTALPKPMCRAYQDWRAAFPVTGASLVFSSNYLNNPSSMYGHTFLRLHRQASDPHGASPLLDYAVNFAANPTTDNQMLYAYAGLSGMFFGTFSLMPYYLKVQEYNNAESRDLWELKLAFTEEHIENLMASLWEVGPHGIRYFYLDENCSFILLALIAAADPAATAVDTFPIIVSPKDTVLALYKQKKLHPPIRRMSAFSRFTARRQQLSSSEEALLKQQIHVSKLLDEVKSLEPAAQIRLLDALAEWIAYQEKLAGSREATEHKELWDETLAARAQFPQTSPPIIGESEATSNPILGQPAQRLTLTMRAAKPSQYTLSLGFRFALHELLSTSAGYASDQEITMGDFRAAIHKNGKFKLQPEQMTIIRIVSIPSRDVLTSALAWTLTLGSELQYGPQNQVWMNHAFEAGAGGAILPTDGIRLFAIPTLTAGRLAKKPSLTAGLGLRLGGLVDITSLGRTGFLANWDTVAHGMDQRFWQVWKVRYFSSFDIAKLNELRFEILWHQYRAAEAGISWMRYF